MTGVVYHLPRHQSGYQAGSKSGTEPSGSASKSDLESLQLFPNYLVNTSKPARLENGWGKLPETPGMTFFISLFPFKGGDHQG